MVKDDPEVAAVVPPAPLDPVVRARAVVEEFGKQISLDPKGKEQLHGLVLKAIDERTAEVQDLQLGRILGSALATL